MGIFNRINKISVLVLPINRKAFLKKYVIDDNYKVIIKEGKVGKGGGAITPTLEDDQIWLKGLLNRPFAIYSHGAKTFLARGDSDLPAFSMQTLDEFLSSSVFAWIRTAFKQPINIILYLVFMAVCLNVLLSLGGFGYIQI